MPPLPLLIPNQVVWRHWFEAPKPGDSVNPLALVAHKDGAMVHIPKRPPVWESARVARLRVDRPDTPVDTPPLIASTPGRRHRLKQMAITHLLGQHATDRMFSVSGKPDTLANPHFDAFHIRDGFFWMDTIQPGIIPIFAKDLERADPPLHPDQPILPVLLYTSPSNAHARLCLVQRAADDLSLLGIAGLLPPQFGPGIDGP